MSRDAYNVMIACQEARHGSDAAKRALDYRRDRSFQVAFVALDNIARGVENGMTADVARDVALDALENIASALRGE